MDSFDESPMGSPMVGYIGLGWFTARCIDLYDVALAPKVGDVLKMKASIYNPPFRDSSWWGFETYPLAQAVTGPEKIEVDPIGPLFMRIMLFFSPKIFPDRSPDYHAARGPQFSLGLLVWLQRC